ncbi:aspartate ammonia-lyase [Tsukamurella sp. 8F]|uniref:aspartate ammonia-lyase n=1 Tax=unclassified Tsukamurella TaxID=2633480 RepID=UPI0023B9EF1B|nr:MULTISPECIES: aspartate ammonia-lyase [unclassified Tsukamurella]MDF0528501.1 aspartate ammonia-lyase [Tsukamurella sp. 8J]MDF0586327.1 aspartate ammonia-lyase [Tsukamurella sp. 8F]
MTRTATRSEHDLLGDMEVPVDVLWGVHTARAVENFPITGRTIGAYPELVSALAVVKQAAARANADLGLLDAERASAIDRAAAEIRAGAHADQFVVDVMQGGAGTSTNFNANEVVCNRALEILGRPRGDYAYLHPADHVNLGQSTNDVYPTALRLAALTGCDRLDLALQGLIGAIAAKASEFDDVVKIGRTQLQDAVPMTLGQEFRGFAVTLGEERARLADAAALLHEINMGATAIGTRLNAPDGYVDAVREHLGELTGRPLVTSFDLIEATCDTGAFVNLSSVLKRLAVKLSKMCNDLRLLSSGPRAGLAEINLPAVQAGSSIMPGKVNPVIPEVVTQVCYAVIGNDVTVTMAAEAGQLQLNAFEPVIARCLFDGMAELTAACETLGARCIRGITANTEALAAQVQTSIGLATALNPHIGYAAASSVAHEALATGRGVAEIVLERGYLTDEALRGLLSPGRLANISTGKE